MDETLQQVSIERAHMNAAHRALNSGLENASGQDPAFAEFYVACVDYIEFIMGRFYAQDQAHVDLLKPKVPKDDKESWDLINEIQTSFNKGRGEVAKLATAKADFTKNGPNSQADFEEVARAYADFFLGQMSKFKHSIRYLMAEHITPEQFRANSIVTEESINREKELFDRLEATAPEGVTIEVNMERPEDAPAPPHQQA